MKRFGQVIRKRSDSRNVQFSHLSSSLRVHAFYHVPWSTAGLMSLGRFSARSFVVLVSGLHSIQEEPATDMAQYKKGELQKVVSTVNTQIQNIEIKVQTSELFTTMTFQELNFTSVNKYCYKADGCHGGSQGSSMRKYLSIYYPGLKVQKKNPWWYVTQLTA